MKRYCVRCREGRVEYFDIVGENSDGFTIRLTRLSDGDEKSFEETMSRDLFDMCIKTGYIFQMEEAKTSVA